jgi:Tfp pilus assembly protein PilO
MVLPRASQIRKRQAEVTAAHDQQQQLEVRLEELRGVQAEAPRNRRQLKALNREVPETARLSAIILMLNDSASDSAVDFMSVTPGNPQAEVGGQTSTIPTVIDVTGDYFSVDEFLYRLERLSRVVKVTQLSLVPGTTTDGTSTSAVSTLTVTISAEFYTTDLSAGPGSIPGHTDAATVAPAPSPSPSSTPGV